MAVQPGLCGTRSKTPKTSFLTSGDQILLETEFLTANCRQIANDFYLCSLTAIVLKSAMVLICN